MNIFQILLWPFTTLITKVFEFSFFLTGNYGLSLILVSFFITLITAPLYILADKWKAEELTLKNKDTIKDEILKVRDETIMNFGKAGEAIVDVSLEILNSL